MAGGWGREGGVANKSLMISCQYEVENSDSVADETIEAATEIPQGHRGHVNRV